MPGACLQGALGVRSVVERAVRNHDRYMGAGDTLPSAVVVAARACGARFTAAQVPVAELPNLLELALVVGDEARARAAADRYVASQRDTAARAWALYEVYHLYKRAHPMRLGAADTIVQRLDALGAAAIPFRSAAHWEDAYHAYDIFDVARMRREALAFIDVWRARTPADLDDFATATTDNPIVNLLVAELVDAPKGAVARFFAFLQQAKWPLVDAMREKYAKGGDGIPDLSYMLEQTESAAVVPPFAAAYWRPPPARPTEGRWPVPGKVSVYVHGGLIIANAEWVGMWRRLLTKYGDALSVTFVEGIAGYFQDSPPLTPEQEADRVAHYYHEVLQLPVTVAFEEAPVKTLPDGRIVRSRAPVQTKLPYRSAGFIVTDRAGKAVLMMPSWLSEAGIEACIEKALKR